MGQNIAADNVNRTYILSGTNIAIFTFMLFFLYPRFEAGTVNSFLFQLTLTVMGIGAFAYVFATLNYYLCSLKERGNGSDSGRIARRADRFWFLGYTMMFLAPSLVLSLIGLYAVAAVWFGLWLVYVLFAIRYFPKFRSPDVEPLVEAIYVQREQM